MRIAPPSRAGQGSAATCAERAGRRGKSLAVRRQNRLLTDGVGGDSPHRGHRRKYQTPSSISNQADTPDSGKQGDGIGSNRPKRSIRAYLNDASWGRNARTYIVLFRENENSPLLQQLEEMMVTTEGCTPSCNPFWPRDRFAAHLTNIAENIGWPLKPS
jgi:hypothetical protein